MSNKQDKKLVQQVINTYFAHLKGNPMLAQVIIDSAYTQKCKSEKNNVLQLPAEKAMGREVDTVRTPQ